MKKISIVAAICVIALAQIAFAQLDPDLISANTAAGMERPRIDPNGPIHEQFITFNDNDGTGNAGTYNSTDTFGLDIFLTWAGYNSYGLSLWLETTADAAPHILLTGFTYGTTFDDPTQPFISYPLGFTLAESNGLFTTPNPSDLGATVLDPHAGGIAPGTAFIGHLSISLNGFAPGIYILQTDATSSHRSIAVSFDGTTVHEENIPVATYTITIVPEPSTAALLSVSAIGLGVWIYRCTVSKESRS